MTTPTTVRLLIAWSDGEDDDDRPTTGQVRAHYPGKLECVYVSFWNVIQLTPF